VAEVAADHTATKKSLDPDIVAWGAAAIGLGTHGITRALGHTDCASIPAFGFVAALYRKRVRHVRTRLL
jgi:hypothetical protein